ncbi:hypothetical protein CQA53_09695 [Helicobacter didelphidarum]|uniref:Thioredoxin reductase n=2 Tax=Helicobacter didelphidarum TaxID=2040648 RepID=A0A3D8I9T9_9HELI|nr:hypothetical protein CQA53_09695 [Helicobacter didelphidarum]
MTTTKDAFGNDIELDSNGNVILKKERIAIVKDEATQLPTTEVIKMDISEETSKYVTDIYHQTNSIIQSSSYANYKPNYLDPNYYTGQKSHLSEFKAIQKLYYKDPIKGAIAPWTKAEKAYYESLKTKRERYKYLVIRSGIRSSVIDIPLDAIANVDENGNLINEKYRELYEIVEANRGLAHLSDGHLAMAEWEIAAGMLGDIKGFSGGQTAGFTARTYQKDVLSIQLGNMWEKAYYGDGYFFYGTYQNPLRLAQVMNLVKKIKPDRFGMYPYIDEILGVDWVMDFSEYLDDRNMLHILNDEIQVGKLIDPRDPRATEQTRREFMARVNEIIPFSTNKLDEFIDNDISNEANKEWLKNYFLLHAKVMAVTPPQGYPNAPTYYIPEYLEELYREGKFDIKLDPRIPAMYRESFPEELRAKILAYAKKHNIKE